MWRPGFSHCVGLDPWVRWRQPTPVFLPGESSWIEEPGQLESIGSQKVRHDWSNLARTHARQWGPPSTVNYEVVRLLRQEKDFEKYWTTGELFKNAFCCLCSDYKCYRKVKLRKPKSLVVPSHAISTVHVLVNILCVFLASTFKTFDEKSRYLFRLTLVLGQKDIFQIKV